MEKDTYLSGWDLFRRIREVDSALQLNVVRLCAIVVFFAIHMFNYLTVDSPANHYQEFHKSSIWLTSAWLLMTFAIFIAYFSQRLPWYAKYFSTLCDICMLTALAAIGEKAHSSILVIYLVIISTSLLRFNVKLIFIATLGSCLGFILLVGMTDKVWFDNNHEVPVTKTTITLAAMLLNGFACCQICTTVRRWIENKGPAGLNNTSEI